MSAWTTEVNREARRKKKFVAEMYRRVRFLPESLQGDAAWQMIGLLAKVGARGLSVKELRKKLRKATGWRRSSGKRRRGMR